METYHTDHEVILKPHKNIEHRYSKTTKSYSQLLNRNVEALQSSPFFLTDFESEKHIRKGQTNSTKLTQNSLVFNDARFPISFFTRQSFPPNYGEKKKKKT